MQKLHTIFFEHLDFWPKIYLILYGPLRILFISGMPNEPTKKNYWILADSGRFKKLLANSDQEILKNKNRLFHFYVFQHCRVVHRNWANTLVISDIYHSKTLYWYTKANSRLESQVAHQILENHTIALYLD